MPLYAYKGIGANGKPNNGVRDADSPKALRQLLRKDGIVVTRFDISKGGRKGNTAGKGMNRDVDFGAILNRVNKAEIAGFTRQLATLLRAGIPLAESLGALFEQVENVKFKAIVGEVRTAVNEGSAFADSLAKHPAMFDNLYTSMVRAGEIAGNLDEVLARLADFMESAAKLKSKVQGAMIYPIIMIIVGAVIMGILMVAVVPQITGVFVQQKQALPWHTRFLVAMSHFLAAYWYAIIVLSGLTWYGFRKWSRSATGQPVWHGFILRAPGVGQLARQVAVSRFTRTMGTMLTAGVPMLRALDTAKDVLGNVVLMDVVEKAKKAVSEGESLAVTLRKSGQFPPTVTHMIAVGERAGELENMLMRVADAYDNDVDTKLERMTAILEPLMLVIMAVGVGFVIFAILTPIMEMNAF
jgi:general secretion pathway protein F